MGASPGEITGKALVLQHPEEAFMIKDIENWILVTKNTDPAWVYIMARAKGLVSEKGSLLSHTAIIGRELKLPTVVGVSNATRIMKRGEKITINGATGEVFRNEADSDK
jgi:pyruvate,water dikinase